VSPLAGNHVAHVAKYDILFRCGGVIGLYFLVKRCCLLYLYAGNGTFALAPYLDIHGEVDTSMR
jgi:hypothetical protein